MKLFWAISSLMLAILCASACLAVPAYRIEALGFTDVEHTRGDGYQYSLPYQLGDDGQVSGLSFRYNGLNFVEGHLGTSAWLFDGSELHNVGLTGAEHTSSGGAKNSVFWSRNGSGELIGFSTRYKSGSIFQGQTAWVYDGSATVIIGLTGSEYTRSNGEEFSEASSINDSGHIIGHSRRYNDTAVMGSDAWLYDRTNYVGLGLIDVEHTRNDGYIYNEPHWLNENGQVVGHTNRYDGGSSSLGRSSWFYDGQSTVKIGLTDNEHTTASGYQYSVGSQLNESGQVAGYSDRPGGGRSVWMYDGTNTINVGLTGPEHTRGTSHRWAQLGDLNEASQVTGISYRYIGDTTMGQSAWMYNGTTSFNIGLVGPEHTRNDGYRYSDIGGLRNNGHVTGESKRYNGTSIDLGQTAWLYDGAATIDIGLVDAEHTRDNGYKFSEILTSNASGQVAGFSNRYSGDTELGRTAWFYDGTSTIAIGLMSLEFTRHDGYRSSGPSNINAAGQIAGTSSRYNGGSELLGQTAWLYDSQSGHTYPLQLSTRSDGYASSSVRYLGHDGLILGNYTLFDEFDNDLGTRPFYFTIAEGAHDLGQLVEGGLSANNWDYLDLALGFNDRGQILGRGKLASQTGGQMAFLLTPVTADFNNDGDVDGRDFLAWQRGESPRPMSAEDLALWHKQYGDGNSLNAVSVIPEPNCLLLVLCSLLLAARVMPRER